MYSGCASSSFRITASEKWRLEPRTDLPSLLTSKRFHAPKTVTIRNAQLADAPPEMTTLATQAFTTDGAQVPLAYEVLYSSADVRESDLYSIGAAIRSSAGDLLFVSKEIIPVITRDNPTENVEILVSQP